MNDEIDNLLNENVSIHKEWLDKAQEIIEIAPAVASSLAQKEWERDRLLACPCVMPENTASDLADDYRQQNLNLRNSLPKLPEIDAGRAVANVAGTTTSGSCLYDYAEDMLHAGSGAVVAWADETTKGYESLQKEDGRIEEIGRLLRMFNPDIADEFSEAEKKYARSEAGFDEMKASALEMRNVLEHYRGELWDRVLKNNRKIKGRFNWQTVINHFAREEQGSRTYELLLTEQDRYKNLHSLLSKIAKSKEIEDHSALNRIHTDYIDHLYMVLSLIKCQ